MRSMGAGGMNSGMDGYGSLGRSRSPDPRADPSYGTRVAVEVADLQDRLAKTESELRKSQAELRLNQGDYERSHAEIEQMQEKVFIYAKKHYIELCNNSSRFGLIDILGHFVIYNRSKSHKGKYIDYAPN